MSLLPVDELERQASAGSVDALLLLARECDARGDGAKAVEWLTKAAATGDLKAKSALGCHLMTEAPYNSREGLKLTMEAAREGSGESVHLLAVLAASGIGLQQSWSEALVHLTRAAELGLKRAREELALLAGDLTLKSAAAQGENLGPNTWEELRGRIEVRKWLMVPQPRLVSKAPRIAVVKDFAAPEVCDWLIERGRPHLRAAQTDDPMTGKARYESARTNSSAELSLADTDVVIHLMRARISALTGPPPMAMEGVAVLHYRPGEQFFPHFDFFDTDSPGYARQVAEYGQRVLTFLGYLNDDYAGGETDFPKISWRYKGAKGDGLFFWNIEPSGRPDRQTQHAGLPPSSGEKWLLSQWVRGRVS